MGQQADLAFYDLNDLAYQPLNDIDRQFVYGETGRGLRTVVVGGRVVLRDGVATTIDEASLRGELAEVMLRYRPDFAANRRIAEPIEGYLLQALERVRDLDVGVDRYLDDAPPPPANSISGPLTAPPVR